MFWTADIEATLNKENVFDFELIVFYNGFEYHTFLKNQLTEIRDFLNDKNEIYFHNLDFDIMFFFTQKIFYDMFIGTTLLNSGNLSIALTRNKTVIFKNSLTILPLPLKKIVSDFLKIDDKDYQNDKENVLNLDIISLENYCKKDCFYLYEAIKKYDEIVGNVYKMKNKKYKRKLTIPSQSLDIFLKCYNDFDGYFNLVENQVFKDLNYYKGGHTEIFTKKIYHQNVYYYDVNSLYPFIMTNIKFDKNGYKRVAISNTKILNLLKKGLTFFIFCEIEIKECSENFYKRFLPTRNQDESKNFYKFGKHKTLLSEIGYKFCLDNNIPILKKLKLFIGRSGVDIHPFKKYVDEMQFLKNNIDKTIGKLFLNSLYGKFGAKKIVKSIHLNSQKTSNANDFGLYGEVFFWSEMIKLPFFSEKTIRYSIAGKITESARLFMQNIFIKEFTNNNNKILYTDTDSLICTKPINKELVDNKVFGKFSNEFENYGIPNDDVYLLSDKFYCFEKSKKIAIKGLKNIDFETVLYNGKKMDKEGFLKMDFKNFVFVKKGGLKRGLNWGVLENPHQVDFKRDLKNPYFEDFFS